MYDVETQNLASLPESKGELWQNKGCLYLIPVSLSNN